MVTVDFTPSCQLHHPVNRSHEVIGRRDSSDAKAKPVFLRVWWLQGSRNFDFMKNCAAKVRANAGRLAQQSTDAAMLLLCAIAAGGCQTHCNSCAKGSP